MTRPTVTTVRGFAMTLHPLDRDICLSRTIFDSRDWEPAIGAVLDAVCKPGGTVYDVGANIGYFTLIMARAVGLDGLVLAVEPDAANADLLEANLAAGGFTLWPPAPGGTGVTVFRGAAGASSDMVTLDRNDINQGDHHTYGNRGAGDVTVPMRTLDSFAGWTERPPDVIKLDVQGYEMEVLRGMARILAADRPMTIITEVEPHLLTAAGSSAGEYVAALRGYGLTLQIIDHGGIRDLDTLDVERAIDRAGGAGHFDLLCTRGGAP